MELTAGECGERVTDEFADPFDCEWMYSRRHRNDDALATLADLASPPPQKLKPIRCVMKPSPLDILAGTLDRLPEMGYFDVGTKIADVEGTGQLTCGFAKQDSLGVSLSSSDDSDTDSSPSARKAVTGKRKRETRNELQHFLGKLVGGMMKRQEKMHNRLIKVMETMEHERLSREEAWRQQEIDRMKQNEEARKEEMERTLSIITFIKSLVGEEIEIKIPEPPPPPPFQPQQHLPERFRDRNFGSAETHGTTRVVHSSGRRWPHEQVHALITSRSEVEEKTGRCVTWDEISARMKEKGYDRSAKKCKEKWENMNKYYKKVLEGKMKQPERSESRSYFEKLGTLYKTNSGNADHSAEKKGE